MGRDISNIASGSLLGCLLRENINKVWFSLVIKYAILYLKQKKLLIFLKIIWYIN